MTGINHESRDARPRRRPQRHAAAALERRRTAGSWTSTSSRNARRCRRRTALRFRPRRPPSSTLPGPGAIRDLGHRPGGAARGARLTQDTRGSGSLPTRLALHRRWLRGAGPDAGAVRRASPSGRAELDMKFGGLDLRPARPGRSRRDSNRRRRGHRRHAHDHRKDAPAEGSPHVILTGKVVCGSVGSAVHAGRGGSAALLERLVGHPVALLVRAHLLTHQPCVESGIRRASPTTAVTGMDRQERAHALLGDGPARGPVRGSAPGWSRRGRG